MQLPTIPPKVEAGFRIVQFLAAVVSLGLWADYLAGLSGSSASSMKAVLGIVVAGTVWASTAAIQYAWKHRNADKAKRRTGAVVGLVVLVVVLDFCFIVLFAAVAGILGPSSHGSGTACAVGDEEDNDAGEGGQTIARSGKACGENKAVFALAIVNVFSFSGSSIMNIMQQLQRPPNPQTLAKGPGDMSELRD